MVYELFLPQGRKKPYFGAFQVEEENNGYSLPEKQMLFEI